MVAGIQARQRYARLMEPSAVLSAELTPDERGHNLLTATDVEIDESAQIGANVILHAGVRVGPGVTIKNNCVIGEQASLALGSRATAEFGAQTVIEAGATICNAAIIFAGASIGPNVIVGDQAFIRERARLAADVVLGRLSSVSADAVVGQRVKIEAYSAVLPGMIVEEDVVIGPMVIGASDNSMGRVAEMARQRVILRRGCRIGAGVCLLPGIEIGEDAYVGAGAVVTESVPAGIKVVGVPARSIGAVAPSSSRA